MYKLYVTHITPTSCKSYLIDNNKESLNEWYLEHTKVPLLEEFWVDICEICPTGCSRTDDKNLVTVTYTKFDESKMEQI